MCMGSKKRPLASLALLALACAVQLCAADNTGRWLDVVFPQDSPVLPVSFSLQGPTTASVRGSSMLLDIHASLLLRNTGTKPISGLTLRVEAQDLTPSGKGSVTLPSLHALPGQVFPVRVDMQLLRPFSMANTSGTMVQISLDCALFSDLTAYGPDSLNSRRALMVYELEARRDRRYLAALLQSGRLAELREELNFGLQDLNPAQLGLELLRGAGETPRRDVALNVGAVAFPGSPLTPLGGNARVSGNEVRSPRIEVRNTSQKTVRSFEMGWIVQDEQGRDFVAGSVPSAAQLAPVTTTTMTQSGTLRFSRPGGQRMAVGSLLAYVHDVEFLDGKVWIPSRADITEATHDPVLRRALATSPEQQRLTEVYRRKGMSGLQEDLGKGN
jgi:hypothetical protein